MIDNWNFAFWQGINDLFTCYFDWIEISFFFFKEKLNDLILMNR